MVSGRAALLVELSVCLVCVCCATVSRTCNNSPPSDTIWSVEG